MDPLTPYLDAVRERLKVCANDPAYNEHDDCHRDLARLLALVEAGQGMEGTLRWIAETSDIDLNGAREVARGSLIRYQTAVQEEE